MAATDLYLIRNNNLTWVKYSQIENVSLTGSQVAYSGVTGVAATDIVTIPGSTMTDGAVVLFTALTGGAGLTANTAYFAVSSSGSTCKLALTPGGSAIDFTTGITASSAIVSVDEMRVWSTAFRDIYSSQTSLPYAAGGEVSFAVPGLVKDFQAEPVGVGGTQASVNSYQDSDDTAHNPLRQTFLNASFWKFDRGATATPRYLYAEYQLGDIVADNPPQT